MEVENKKLYMGALSSLENVRRRIVDATKEIGADSVPSLRIPQICAVGDQSSGKSALMEAVSGIPFPQNTGTCTKCPIVVDMQPLQEGDEGYFCIDDGQKLKKTEICEAIRQRQGELVRSSSSGLFSDVPMNIKAITKNHQRLVCVDLPGIIHVEGGDKFQEGEEAKEAPETADGNVGLIRSMIERNIKPVETLIMVVMPGHQDEELATALKLARSADKKMRRTLRVYTKCDVNESDEQQASLRRKVKNAAHKLRMGEKLAPHFVAVRNKKNKVSAEDENIVLKETLGLEDEDMCVVGQAALANRLEPLLSERILENFGSLRDQIESHRQSAQEKLRLIGDHPKELSDILDVLEQEFKGQLRGFDNNLTKLMSEFREIIHKTKEEADDEEKNQKAFSDTYSAFSSPFFQGEEAFLQRVKDICNVWKPLANDFVTKVADVVSEVSNVGDGCDESVAFNVKDELRRDIQKECKRFAREVHADLENRVGLELEKENRYGTCNHYLTAKFEADMRVPPELIKSVLQGLSKADFPRGAVTNSFLVDFDKGSALDAIVKAISGRLETRCTKFAKESLEEQQQERLDKAVSAYWSVMHKNFLDNVLKVVRDVALEGMKRWIGPSGLRATLRRSRGRDREVEHEHVAKKRATLKRVVELMDACENDLHY